MTSNLLLSNSEVKISHTNFDNIILKYDPKANVDFKILEKRIRMNINFEKDKHKDNTINLLVRFYNNGHEVNYNSIEIEDIILLVKAYHEYLMQLIRKNQQQSVFSLPKLKDFFKSIVKFNIVSKTKEIKDLLQRYKNLKVINILSMTKHNSQYTTNNVIAKTIIELDADIVTVLPQELSRINSQMIPWLLNIHRSMVIKYP